MRPRRASVVVWAMLADAGAAAVIPDLSHMSNSSVPGGPIELDALPESPVCADGLHPLYRTQTLAMAVSPESRSHSLRVGMYTAYMPVGMSMGVSMNHGVPCPKGLRDATGVFELPLSAFCVGGNYPLFTTDGAAVDASSDRIAHSESFGDYTFFMPGAVSATRADAACPDGQLDMSAAREGRIAAPPPAPPMQDGGGLSPRGVAAIVVCSVLTLASIVAATTHWNQKSARRRAAGANPTLDDMITSQGPSASDSQAYT